MRNSDVWCNAMNSGIVKELQRIRKSDREHEEAILWFIANIDQARRLLVKWLELGSCCY